MDLSAKAGHQPKRSLIKPVIQCLLILTGALLVADSLLVAPKGPVNAGVVMPALIGLPLLIWGIFYQNLHSLSSHGILLGVKWLLIVGYALFVLSFVFLVVKAVQAARGSVPTEADIVLVLGASLRGRRVSQTLARRLDTSVAFLRKNPHLPVVVSGGQGADEELPEGVAMGLYLNEKGIARERVLIEDRAANTYENLVLSRPLIRQATHCDDPLTVIVTSRSHLYRATLMAARLGYRAVGIGAPDPLHLMPNALLREYLAVMKYHLLGY